MYKILKNNLHDLFLLVGTRKNTTLTRRRYTSTLLLHNILQGLLLSHQWSGLLPWNSRGRSGQQLDQGFSSDSHSTKKDVLLCLGYRPWPLLYGWNRPFPTCVCLIVSDETPATLFSGCNGTAWLRGRTTDFLPPFSMTNWNFVSRSLDTAF